jgi:preprotein translocase subunit SecE
MSSKTKDEDEAEEGGLGPITQARRFLIEVRQELNKVTWPERKETIASTGVILVLVLVTAAYLGSLDWGVSRLVRLLLK